MHKSNSCLKPSLLDFRSRQRKISSFEDLICNKHGKCQGKQAAFAGHKMNIGCREPERSNLRAGGAHLKLLLGHQEA